MLIMGLTGSIGMGKTTAANAFRRLGVPVYDSDGMVHRLLGAGGGAVETVAAAFPGVLRGRAVDRARLGEAVFGRPEKLLALEEILHPLVLDQKNRFLAANSRRKSRHVVIDSPLLFETGGDVSCDITITVSAPDFIQERRVLSRPGMSKGRFNKILASQMPDYKKRALSDFVLLTGLGRIDSLRQIYKILLEASDRQPRKWRPGMDKRKSTVSGVGSQSFDSE